MILYWVENILTFLTWFIWHKCAFNIRLYIYITCIELYFPFLIWPMWLIWLTHMIILSYLIYHPVCVPVCCMWFYLTRHLFFSRCYFWFLKIKSFFLPFSVFLLRSTRYSFFLLILLFGLRAKSAIYHLESLYITDFHIPMLEHVLYKIYNSVILKHLAHRLVTRQFTNSMDKHT